MSRLLALDQASRTSGWAVFSNDVLLDSGTFTTTSQNIGQRLYEIKKFVLGLIQKFQINEVIFEDIQMQGNVVNNVATFKVLAEVIGMLTETFEEIGLPYEAVLASTWKSKLSIRGANRSAQKKNAQAYVFDTYEKKVSQDESDAICIGSYKISKDDSVYDWSN